MSSELTQLEVCIPEDAIPLVDAPVSEELAQPRHWKVVGGIDSDGIIVRAGRELDSAKIPQRLATDSIIEELDIQSNRLNFELVRGSGPSQGWVSIQLQGKHLVVPTTPLHPPAPVLAHSSPKPQSAKPQPLVTHACNRSVALRAGPNLPLNRQKDTPPPGRNKASLPSTPCPLIKQEENMSTETDTPCPPPSPDGNKAALPDTPWPSSKSEEKKPLVADTPCPSLVPEESKSILTDTPCPPLDPEESKAIVTDTPCPPPAPEKLPMQYLDAPKRRIRELMLGGWRMAVRGGFVSPPSHFGRSGPNPIADLGECGDPKCGCFRPAAPKVRPAFEEFCINMFRTAARDRIDEFVKTGISYISVGCGALYFDWEFLERLHEMTGIAAKRIALIDTDYRDIEERVRRALRQFERWFSGCNVKYYRSIKQFLQEECATDLPRLSSRLGLSERAAKQFELKRQAPKPYQVIMQCDAEQVDNEEGNHVCALRNRALQAGGLAFRLGNPPQRRCWQKPLDGSDAKMIDSADWRYPGWGSRNSPGQLQKMPSSDVFAVPRREQIHSERVSILRCEYPHVTAEVPHEALQWGDEALESFFRSGGKCANHESYHSFKAVTFCARQTFLIKKKNPGSQITSRVSCACGTSLATTGQLYIGKLGGKWVEEQLPTGKGGAWYLIFGPGYDLSEPLLHHPDMELDKLGAWLPPPPCRPNHSP